MTSTMERRNSTTQMMAERIEYADTLQAIGAYLLRYGLVVVIAWIGFMKFTAYEAAGIQPLVANSPLMSWVYSIFSVGAFSAALGVVEITIAAMIALRVVSPKLCVLGSALAIGMFLTTLSFILSTPGSVTRTA